MALKQVILIRQDLQLPKGKMAGQAAHAAVEATLKADDSLVSQWRTAGQKKVVLKIPSEKELYRFIQMAKDSGMPTALITDAGKTVIEPGTVTCGAIGPYDEDEVDQITGELGMM